jgi:SAM-dependent methyltransferase
MKPRKQHWEDVYQVRDHDLVSWYQADPILSVELISSCGTNLNSPLIDVGGGSSVLVDRLLETGYIDISVIDLSPTALRNSRTRLGERARDVTWIESDITDHMFDHHFAIWHDRAVFHFLTEPEDQERYVDQIRNVIPAGGHVIIATFAPDGPDQCSGLPVQRYDEQSLSDVLGAGFEPMRFEREAHRTPSGSIQRFVYGSFTRTVDSSE